VETFNGPSRTTDSGLASWIVEKYRTWSDCGGDVERRFTKDELLTIVTIYWVTQTISSSTRMYYENQKNLWAMEKDQEVSGPAGIALFPQEIAVPPGEWGERSYDVRRWTGMPRGGHFAVRRKNPSCWLKIFGPSFGHSDMPWVSGPCPPGGVRFRRGLNPSNW